MPTLTPYVTRGFNSAATSFISEGFIAGNIHVDYTTIDVSSIPANSPLYQLDSAVNLLFPVITYNPDQLLPAPNGILIRFRKPSGVIIDLHGTSVSTTYVSCVPDLLTLDEAGIWKYQVTLTYLDGTVFHCGVGKFTVKANL